MYENLLPRFTLCENRNTLRCNKHNDTINTNASSLCTNLKKELEELGMSDVIYNETNGFVIATLPSNVEKDVRSIGFIAHMDTADFNAVNVSPQIVENYDGESTIPLDKEGKFTLNTKDFPNLKIIVVKHLSQPMVPLY